MLVVVDANILMKDWFLRDRKWDAASAAIKAGRLRLVLPSVARLEVIGGYRRHVEDKVKQVASALRKSSPKARRAAEALLAVYTAEEQGYPAALDARLREVGFEIARPADEDHLAIVQRAVDRVAPFDERGEGYRDTLIWLTALDQLEDDPFHRLTFLSDDAIFTKRQNELREELQCLNAEGDLTVLRSLTGIEFPGEYEDGPFDLSRLGFGLDAIEDAIAEALTGADITPWTPPGPDYADVSRVNAVSLAESGVIVRKRYGENVFDLTVEATADIDADVLIIRVASDGELEARNTTARWNLNLRWHGETEPYGRRLSDIGTFEMTSIEERPRRADAVERGHVTLT
ncbi:PIN domain-containing protein [Microbacterium sp. 22296]|uniref:PIN domain-containing protein n=1 Tax=Microbacterium sp. 22296 TaxID=3453903 RepID=UPI003F862DAD